MLDTEGHPDISDQVQVVWAPDSLQGLLWGLCQVEGETCWFDVLDYEKRGKESELRVYQVVRLTDDQREAEVARQLCYQEYVGTHHNFACNRRMKGIQRPERFHKRFYERYPDNHHRQGRYDGNPVLGVFYEKKLSRKKPVVPKSA